MSRVVLVVGVLKWEWYIDQIAMLFLGMGVILGLAGGLGGGGFLAGGCPPRGSGLQACGPGA